MRKADCKPTQNDRILRYMRDFGSITQIEAMRDLGVMRLASRISDLKSRGYQIKTTWESSRNRYGEAVSYKRYRLEEKCAGQKTKIQSSRPSQASEFAGFSKPSYRMATTEPRELSRCEHQGSGFRS